MSAESWADRLRAVCARMAASIAARGEDRTPENDRIQSKIQSGLWREGNDLVASDVLPHVVGDTWAWMDGRRGEAYARYPRRHPVRQEKWRGDWHLIDHVSVFRRAGSHGWGACEVDRGGVITWQPYEGNPYDPVCIAGKINDIEGYWRDGIRFWCRPDLSWHNPGSTVLILVAKGLPEDAAAFGFDEIGKTGISRAC